MEYTDVLRDQFAKETDRAAVILAASIAEELLQAVLSARLVPISSPTDELLDGANAPLGTFNSRIEAAYRLGIISVRFARDLHLIRKIRNDFAHNIHGCSFTDARVTSRVGELTSSHGIIRRSADHFRSEPSVREQFLEGACWMVFHLEELSKAQEAFKPCDEEWGYSFEYGSTKQTASGKRASSAEPPAPQA